MAIVSSSEAETSNSSRPLMRWNANQIVPASIILLALVFRIWNLNQNGFGNPYYAAAVKSMLLSFNNFFFVAFDPGGYVSVDKPPVALWFQAISAKVLGFSGVSVLLPQAIAGVLAVAALIQIVGRASGRYAGWIAGFVLAISPASVAVDRDNLPDPFLVLFLVLAAGSLLRAIESKGLRWLVLSTALVGVAFNVKMLAAFVVLPTFYLVYLIGSQRLLFTRLVHLCVATVVLFLVSLSWAAVVDMTPASQRPYMGGSTNNSALNLALGYNGLGRVFGGSGNLGGPPGGGMGPPPGMGGSGPAGGLPPVGILPGMPRMALGLMPFGGPPGPFRFVFPAIAGQISWLFPLVFFGMFSLGLRTVGRERFAHLLWTGWFITHLVVFSLSRGIMHPYYVTVMAPAVAALLGPGILAMNADSKAQGKRSRLLLIALMITAIWEAITVAVLSPEWRLWLVTAILIGMMATVIGLVRKSHHRSKLVIVGGSIATLLAPFVWSLTPVLAKGNGLFPAADPALLYGGGFDLPGMTGEPPAKLIRFLETNRHGEKFLLATPMAPMAAPVIISTGQPVMALGGFIGADPILTAERFAEMVAAREVRFVQVMGGMPFGPGPGPGGPFGGKSEVIVWVEKHGKKVDQKLWKDESSETPSPFPTPFGGMTDLYDCRPDQPLISPSKPEELQS